MTRRGSKRRRAHAFLKTKKGQEWLERKIAEKHRLRPDPGPAPERLRRTQFPFIAEICGRQAMVSRNAYGIQIDYLEEGDQWHPPNVMG